MYNQSKDYLANVSHKIGGACMRYNPAKSTKMPKLVDVAIKEGIRDSLKVRFKKRRGKLEIMVDILSVTRGGARKTEIVYKANLNFTRIERYIPFLKERGLMETTGSIYRTTEKGEEFLRDYQKIKELLVT